MKKITTTILTVVMTVSISLGQMQEATTVNGEKVILNSDGTWKIADIKIDTAKTNRSDCNNWIVTEIDKVTGNTSITCKNNIIVSSDGNETGLAIFMMQATKKQIILNITAVGAGPCVDKGSAINILFDDGSRLKLLTDGAYNCDSEAKIYFGGTFGKKQQLIELKTKKIQTIRVWTNDGFVEKDFTSDNQEEFYNIINCLTKKDYI